MRFIDAFICKARMSPALNGSSAIRRFEHSDAIEIRNGITFDFYMGLPHIYHLIQENYVAIGQLVNENTNCLSAAHDYPITSKHW